MGSKLNVKLGENENGGSQLKHLNIQLSSDVWLHLPLTETCSPDNPLIHMCQGLQQPWMVGHCRVKECLLDGS